MIARNIALAVAGFLLLTACAAQDAAAREEALLNVGQGQIPNDTGSDGATTMTIEDVQGTRRQGAEGRLRQGR